MATSPSYSFHPTGLNNFLNFAEYPGAFSPPECDAIIEMGLAAEVVNAGITTDNYVDEVYRKTHVSWLECLDSNAWVWHKIAEISTRANDDFYCMDLLGFRECFQFTMYDEEGSHYNWHMDFGTGRMSIRKLSVVIQLTDPSEYEGGDLELLYGAEPAVANKTRGTVVVFPSYTMHRVTPVTSGKRYSGVLWVSGQHPYR